MTPEAQRVSRRTPFGNRGPPVPFQVLAWDRYVRTLSTAVAVLSWASYVTSKYGHLAFSNNALVGDPLFTLTAYSGAGASSLNSIYTSFTAKPDFTFSIISERKSLVLRYPSNWCKICVFRPANQRRRSWQSLIMSIKRLCRRAISSVYRTILPNWFAETDRWRSGVSVVGSAGTGGNAEGNAAGVLKSTSEYSEWSHPTSSRFCFKAAMNSSLYPADLGGQLSVCQRSWQEFRGSPPAWIASIFCSMLRWKGFGKGSTSFPISPICHIIDTWHITRYLYISRGESVLLIPTYQVHHRSKVVRSAFRLSRVRQSEVFEHTMDIDSLKSWEYAIAGRRPCEYVNCQVRVTIRRC